MQFSHVHVEITEVIICHFLLFDYKIICGYVTYFLNVTQHWTISFSKNLHFVGYLHKTLWPSGLGNNFMCTRFAVQTLLWSLEFVIQINLKHNDIAV